jgi:ElaB/YqjD/DUF883 family membrane-anchored ribosome-binding protein
MSKPKKDFDIHRKADALKEKAKETVNEVQAKADEVHEETNMNAKEHMKRAVDKTQSALNKGKQKVDKTIHHDGPTRADL